MHNTIYNMYICICMMCTNRRVREKIEPNNIVIYRFNDYNEKDYKYYILHFFKKKKKKGDGTILYTAQ